MNVDHYFEIGSSHEMCEDYAISGILGHTIAYAIVSDGCSSSPEVDVGARLLCHAAREFLRISFSYSQKIGFNQGDQKFWEFNSALGNYAISSANLIAKQLALSSNSLDCTLLVAIADYDVVNVFVYGDGGYIIRRFDDTVVHTKLQYLCGAPYYLSYLINGERNAAYNKEYGESIVNKQTAWFAPDPMQPCDEISDHGCVFEMAHNIYDVMAMSFQNTDVKSITLVTDGIESYRNDNKDLMDSSKMVRDFVSYKTIKGKFVRRRMNRIKKNCLKTGRDHFDDIAVASIHKGV